MSFVKDLSLSENSGWVDRARYRHGTHTVTDLKYQMEKAGQQTQQAMQKADDYASQKIKEAGQAIERG